MFTVHREARFEVVAIYIAAGFQGRRLPLNGFLESAGLRVSGRQRIHLVGFFP